MDKMTVHEVSRLTGISIRTLQYYDKTGLLPAPEHTDAGYRLYDDSSLERLQQILLFRELEFPLKDIKNILDSPGFDRDKALTQQIELLTLRKEQLERLISLAKKLRGKTAENSVSDFSAFDKQKLREYAERAKREWGSTAAYKEYMSKDRPSDEESLQSGLMDIFREFGGMKELPPDSPQVISLVKRLQSYITDNFYTCTDDMLQSLAAMYTADDEFRQNIDAAGGEGTAEFVRDAVNRHLGSLGR
ncbi:MAG: MerR family transcriptional regulator [Oscillospiraceae bacterium]|nr:MerR family transcriptional regulator [Oscillospiraceae bacterium]